MTFVISHDEVMTDDEAHPLTHAPLPAVHFSRSYHNTVFLGNIASLPVFVVLPLESAGGRNSRMQR